MGSKGLSGGEATFLESTAGPAACCIPSALSLDALIAVTDPRLHVRSAMGESSGVLFDFILVEKGYWKRCSDGYWPLKSCKLTRLQNVEAQKPNATRLCAGLVTIWVPRETHSA